MRFHDPSNASAFAFALASALLLAVPAPGCQGMAEPVSAAAHAPAPDLDWPVSTPAAEGLDSVAIAQLYARAAKVRTIRSLLVVRDGRLVAEQYFHGATREEPARLQSVTKSVMSALAGIAIRDGCLSSVAQRMMEFFPELADRVRDPRKHRITIEQLLEMRAGYPWEESSRELFELLYDGFRPSTLTRVPLARDPGSGFDYSNLSSHLLGIVVARACSTSLRTLAETRLFGPLGVTMGEWTTDWEGNFNGHADLHLRPRDMAKFGLLYLNEGDWRGDRIVPADWVRRSLGTYSEDAWRFPIGPHVADLGYGYQWWTARAGPRRYHFAWGHGGQQIALVPDQRLVIVVTADPLVGQHGGGSWKREKENLNLVGDFVAGLGDGPG